MSELFVRHEFVDCIRNLFYHRFLKCGLLLFFYVGFACEKFSRVNLQDIGKFFYQLNGWKAPLRFYLAYVTSVGIAKFRQFFLSNISFFSQGF